VPRVRSRAESGLTACCVAARASRLRRGPRQTRPVPSFDIATVILVARDGRVLRARAPSVDCSRASGNSPAWPFGPTSRRLALHGAWRVPSSADPVAGPARSVRSTTFLRTDARPTTRSASEMSRRGRSWAGAGTAWVRSDELCGRAAVPACRPARGAGSSGRRCG
jgi:hypothetical protein